jgi:hypothetical protein
MGCCLSKQEIETTRVEYVPMTHSPQTFTEFTEISEDFVAIPLHI